MNNVYEGIKKYPNMSKRVYISADYGEYNGDRDVVNELNKWGQDSLHKVDFVDMAQVASGTIAEDSDCRICDLKAEFNRQTNASSAVIFIVGNKTAVRAAGCMCSRWYKAQSECTCTPYKENRNGVKPCRVAYTSTPGEKDDYGNINSCSYLQHEFEQAKKKDKDIIILYNSTRYETYWLPLYMKGYENYAHPFWKYNERLEKIGDYFYIKEALGFV